MTKTQPPKTPRRCCRNARFSSSVPDPDPRATGTGECGLVDIAAVYRDRSASAGGQDIGVRWG